MSAISLSGLSENMLRKRFPGKRNSFHLILVLFSELQAKFYRKIHHLTREFHVKFHAKNRYGTNREAMSAISVFQVKFNVEFTSQAVNFP